ncbi:MAG: thioredoxin family protein [Polyangiaceae bacterium]
MKIAAPLHLLIASTLAVGCGASAADAVPVVAVAGSTDGPREVTPSDAATSGPKELAVATKIPWMTSEEEARTKAKARHLPLVVFLCADWAVPAMRMDREVWTDPRILRRVSDFVALRLDVTEADANAQAQADHFDLQTMPSTIFLDDSGAEVARLEGFADVERVLKALDAARSPDG